MPAAKICDSVNEPPFETDKINGFVICSILRFKRMFNRMFVSFGGQSKLYGIKFVFFRGRRADSTLLGLDCVVPQSLPIHN